MATEQQAQLVSEINAETKTTGTTPAWVLDWEKVETVTSSQQAVTSNSDSISAGQQPTTSNSDSVPAGWQPIDHMQENFDNSSWVNSQSSKDTWIMTKDERHDIGEDIKKSFKDLWRIPYLLILPLINLIQGQYDKIPESRRQGFARMTKDIKASGKDGIQKLKDRWNKKDEKKGEAKTDTPSTDTPPTTWTADSWAPSNTVTTAQATVEATKNTPLSTESKAETASTPPTPVTANIWQPATDNWQPWDWEQKTDNQQPTSV